MPKAAPPKTPFSTPLSGSARETEDRIRNIFQYQKKRPPVLALLLACALALLCGGLVSCETQSPAPSLSQEEEQLLSLLAAEDQSIWEEGDEPRLLTSIQQGEYLLGAAAYSHRLGDTLLIGVMDRETGELTAPAYQQGIYHGTPYVTTFQQNGVDYLLYTANGMHQGLSYGRAGLVAFQGDDFTWAWPVEGDLRDERSQAFADYNNYWEDHLALLAPGGVDVFTRTGYAVIDGDGPQWAVDHSENFYIPEEGDLPIPIPYQTRVWVENFTRDSRNALSAGNRSALYHIVSMTPEEPVPGQRKGDSLYSLLAFCNGRAGEGEGGWLSAVLLFDQETGQVGDVLAWAQGDREAVALPRESWGGLEERDRLISEYYQSQGYSQIYFPGETAPEVLPETALAIESIVYGDEMADGAMRSIAYEVTFRAYYGEGMSDYLVLQKDGADGSFLRLLGQYPAHAGKSARDTAFQETFGLMDADVSLPYDSSSPPVGLGDWQEPSYLVPGGEPTVEILEGWEPIYNPGDYWDRWSVDGFTALRYYHASEDRWTVQSIETTRTDLRTYRGIQVGDSRSMVQNLYSELRDGDYWHLYDSAEEDFLWYCDSSMDLGPALLFFFENDQVSRIVLYNMFD